MEDTPSVFYGGKFPPPKIGRPPTGKVVVSLRLDPEVIEYFREDGPGHLQRINDVLVKYVRRMRRTSLKMRSAMLSPTEDQQN